jgi:hypothetical protein
MEAMMETDDPWGLVGRRYTAASRIFHQFTGEPANWSGPLELTWDDGQVTLLDVRSDWTLSISRQKWIDPYAGAGPDELEVLGRDVGLWHRQVVTDSDELAKALGNRVIGVEPWLNEIGEFSGLDIEFNRHRLVVRQFAGDPTVRLSPR